MKNKAALGFVMALVLAVVPFNALSAKDVKSDNVVLTKGNVIILNTEVDGESTSAVISQAKKLDAELSDLRERVGGAKAPIYIFLNTPGGSVQAGLEMIEALRGLNRPINTITLFAASMGFQIAQNLDKRLIIRNGILMSHRAKGSFEGEFGGQAPSQIDSRYALWKSRLDEMDAKTVSRTNGKQTMASYQKQYASEMWLTGNQSVEQGYADQVTTIKCDTSLAGATDHTLLFMGVIPVTYQLDNCPINTSPMNIKVGIATNQGSMDSESFIKKGGNFGINCLVESVTNKALLCALDTSLNVEKIGELKNKFLNHFTNQMHRVVDSF